MTDVIVVEFLKTLPAKDRRAIQDFLKPDQTSNDTAEAGPPPDTTGRDAGEEPTAEA